MLNDVGPAANKQLESRSYVLVGETIKRQRFTRAGKDDGGQEVDISGLAPNTAWSNVAAVRKVGYICIGLLTIAVAVYCSCADVNVPCIISTASTSELQQVRVQEGSRLQAHVNIPSGQITADRPIDFTGSNSNRLPSSSDNGDVSKFVAVLDSIAVVVIGGIGRNDRLVAAYNSWTTSFKNRLLITDEAPAAHHGPTEMRSIMRNVFEGFSSDADALRAHTHPKHPFRELLDNPAVHHKLELNSSTVDRELFSEAHNLCVPVDLSIPIPHFLYALGYSYVERRQSCPDVFLLIHVALASFFACPCTFLQKVASWSAQVSSRIGSGCKRVS
jgi:hypothetical protein